MTSNDPSATSPAAAPLPIDLRSRVRLVATKPAALPAGLARYLRGCRISPGRVVIGSHTTVEGNGRWEVAGGKLAIGVLGMGFSDASDRTVVRNDGTISISGHVRFNKGSRVVVRDRAQLRVGAGTFINPFTIVEVANLVEIGTDCAISWRCDIMDTSFHRLDYPGRRPEANSIRIGNHVWVGAGVRLLPGTDLGDGCVVASGSTVNTVMPPNALVGGSPARVLRSDVSWAL